MLIFADLIPIKPLPRLPLQDASDRINHSPVRLAPIQNTVGDPNALKSPMIILNDATTGKVGAAIASAITFGDKGATSKPVAGTATKKRKADPETSLAEDIAAYKQNLDHIYVDDIVVDMNCSQVRRRINQVLDGAS